MGVWKCVSPSRASERVGRTEGQDGMCVHHENVEEDVHHCHLSNFFLFLFFFRMGWRGVVQTARVASTGDGGGCACVSDASRSDVVCASGGEGGAPAAALSERETEDGSVEDAGDGD